MFKKILIANRGEIACRIIKTAHRLGIACVAVYSEADKNALFVSMADEALCVGPAAAAESYLAIEKIVEACRKTDSEAVHPGYGFLSEQAAFPLALQAAGVRFIGPNINAIATMGDKIAAKRRAEVAKVACVPGSDGALADAGQAIEVAETIGYPVMLKAAAGGGGIGVRIARSRQEVTAGFAEARAQAASAFADDRLFVEKFIADARHIEIQVLGDMSGNVIHLGERECSLQRRHQKLVEEAPAPNIGDATRHKMSEQAVALARAVAYDFAGTVEFVVGPDESFYFVEMNTRLQVEHPVSELVTGIDLVEAMIRIAAGERLALTQADIHVKGAALESRIYAEDPAHDFLPSAGRLVTFRPPAESHHAGVTVRHDTGFVEGGEISVHYDPLIGKLITHAVDRAAALAAQADALDQFVIEGVSHNILFLAALMQNARVKQGRLSTQLIAEDYKDGFTSRPPQTDEAVRLAIVAAAIDHVTQARRRSVSGQTRGAEPIRVSRERVVLVDETATNVMLDERDDGLVFRVDERNYHCLSDWRAGMKIWAGTIDGKPIFVQVRPLLDGYGLRWRGISVEARVYTPRQAELVALMPKKQHAQDAKTLLCPMPGLVKAVLVGIGQAVKAGEALCIVEAMKMETTLRAERDGVVKAIDVAAGERVDLDALLIEFV